MNKNIDSIVNTKNEIAKNEIPLKVSPNGEKNINNEESLLVNKEDSLLVNKVESC